MLSTLLLVLHVLLLSLSAEGQSFYANRICNRVLRNNNAQNGVTPDTRIRLSCDTGEIRWRYPRNEHLLTFTNSHRDLVVCLTVTKAGARIYRPKGSQRQLIADVDDTGFMGCFRSECSHVSFLFQVDANYSGPNILKFQYSGYIDDWCPLCTETCQKECLCGSDFSFQGKLRSAIYRSNLNVYYFQVAEYIKYHGTYKDPFLAQLAGECPSNTNETNNETLLEYGSGNETETALDSEVVSQMESEGLLRVYAKCPLKTNKTYFVSTNLHFTKNGRPQLIMCCQHHDEPYALNYLTNLLHNQECCAHS